MVVFYSRGFGFCVCKVLGFGSILFLGVGGGGMGSRVDRVR